MNHFNVTRIQGREEGYMATCPHCGTRRRLGQSKSIYLLPIWDWWIYGHGNCDPLRVGNDHEVRKMAHEYLVKRQLTRGKE